MWSSLMSSHSTPSCSANSNTCFTIFRHSIVRNGDATVPTVRKNLQGFRDSNKSRMICGVRTAFFWAFIQLNCTTFKPAMYTWGRHVNDHLEACRRSLRVWYTYVLSESDTHTYTDGMCALFLYTFCDSVFARFFPLQVWTPAGKTFAVSFYCCYFAAAYQSCMLLHINHACFIHGRFDFSRLAAFSRTHCILHIYISRTTRSYGTRICSKWWNSNGMRVFLYWVFIPLLMQTKTCG